MKHTPILTVALLCLVATQLWAQQAAAPQPAPVAPAALTPAAPAFQPPIMVAGGVELYKMEAMKLLVTPTIKESAKRMTDDLVWRERIEMAMSTDSLFYDGLRLVRSRGVITGDNSLDDLTVYRAVKAFSVTPKEAKAWLVASRLMQMGEFKDDGVALTGVEESVLHTSSELFCQLRAKFGFESACRIMPRLSVTLGYAVDRDHEWYRQHRHLCCNDQEFADRDQARKNMEYAGADGMDIYDMHGPVVGHCSEY
jgi:hypothetical protein